MGHYFLYELLFIIFTEALDGLHTSKKDVKDICEKLVLGAKDQLGLTLVHNPAYQNLAYPNGDVPIKEGVCTDVIVRAFRKAFKIDLQRLIHEDMKKRWDQYPKLWQNKKPDSNIDHRRVQNLTCFFDAYGMSVDDETYIPADIIVWDLGGGILHIGILSDAKNSNSLYQKDTKLLVIHNIARGVREEDILDDFKIIGHYRLNEEIIKKLKAL